MGKVGSLNYHTMNRESFDLEVVTCFRSLKSGGNLSIDPLIGNPMTNPPKNTKLNADLFNVEFRNLTNGNLYKSETKRHYKVGEIQAVIRASFLDRLSSSVCLIEKESGKKLYVVFL